MKTTYFIRYFVLLILLFPAYQVNAQLPDSTSVLYAGVDNEIKISIPNVPASQITVSTQDGTIRNAGEGRWLARPNYRTTLFMLTVETTGKNKKKFAKIYEVQPLPPLRLYIAYKDEDGVVQRYRGSVPIDKKYLIESEGIGADRGNLSYYPRIESFKIQITDAQGGVVQQCVNRGKKFTAEIKNKIRQMPKGSKFYIRQCLVLPSPYGIRTELPPLEVIISDK
jgi:hypothetical protein